MNTFHKMKSEFLSDKYKVSFSVLLVFLCIFSIYALGPQIAGDSMLYVNSINVLETGIVPEAFVPMMILTTPLALALIMFFKIFTGDLGLAWLVLDSVMFVIMGLFFYSLAFRFSKDSRTSFYTSLFFVTNYAAISFGLAYMMDIGGWAFYVASLYFSYRYLESDNKSNKWIYMSSLMVGIGGLYKEYAFVAFVIIFGAILWKYWRNWKDIFIKTFISGILAFSPFLLMNVYTYFVYNGYTYIDWFFHQKIYAYQNRVVEFTKSFGSIYNFLWPFIIGGFYIILKKYKDLFTDKNLFFIFLTLVSCFSVLLWPVVTRVLYITAPAFLLVASIYIKKIEANKIIILPILILYVLSSYYMDAYILDFISLPF